MTTALVPISDMERMAQAIATSKLFGIQNTEQALALMIVAVAENRHPGSVAAEYHIIQNRPALKADAMLARFQQAGGKVAWADYTDEKVAAVFTHEAGGSVRIEWDMARAKKAGLGGKDNWTKYPRQMLRARVISEGVRTCFPAVCVGIYTPEEVQDFDKPQRKTKDMGRAEVVDAEGVIHEGIPASERPVSATNGLDSAGHPPAAPSSPSAHSAGAEPETREQTIKRLCDATGSNRMNLLANGDVKHEDEFSQEDYDSLVRMLTRRLDKLADKVQA